MPVSHVGLTVSHIPSACSFFLAALQPLGYKYVGKQGDQVGFGTYDADFFLSPEVPGIKSSNAHVAFSAASTSVVRNFYAAALNAGGLPNGAPSSRGCNDCVFNAAVLDLDGNSIEVIYHEDENDDAHTTVSGGSRVLTWRSGIVNVQDREEKHTYVPSRKSQSSLGSSASSVAESLARSKASSIASKAPSVASQALSVASKAPSVASKAPSIARSVSMPASTAPPQTSDSDSPFNFTGKAVIGTLLGAAAGAAVAYAMVKSEQDSARQEAAFEEAMIQQASSRAASSKAPSIAPSVAQSSKAPPPARTVFSYATTNKTVPASEGSSGSRSRMRTHRNFSVTESVVESRVTGREEEFSDEETETEVTELPPRAKSEVRAIEAPPEPQYLEDIDARSYHSPTYISLAPTKATKKPETLYIAASKAPSMAPSKALSMAPSKAPSMAPSKAPSMAPSKAPSMAPSKAPSKALSMAPSKVSSTQKQIEYIPASVVSQRPSVASRRAVTSPPTIVGSQLQIEDTPSSQAPQDDPDWTPDDLVVARRDSAMSVYSTHSNKSKHSKHTHRETSSDRASKHSDSSRHRSHVSSHHSSKHRDRSPSHRSERRDTSSHRSTTSRRSSKHHFSTHRDESPSRESNASTIKASRVNPTTYYSAAEVALPASRKTSVVSAADMALPSSQKTSVVSAADQPLPSSRKTSVVSAMEMPLPMSRKTSVVSAAELPLPISRKTSVVSGAEISLPESRRSSVVSAMERPLPLSRAPSMASATQISLSKSRTTGSIVGSILGRSNHDRENDEISAARLALPESRAGSLVGSLLGRSGPRGLEDTATLAPDDSISCVASSRQRERSESPSHSPESRKSSSSKRHRHSKSGRGSEAGSDATTVRPVKSSRHSTLSLPVHMKSRSGIEKDEKKGKRSIVSMAFGG